MTTPTATTPSHPAPIASSRRAPRRGSLARRDRRVGAVLVSPTFVVVLVMVIAPLLWSFVIAFQRLRLINIGTQSLFSQLTLDNFRVVFATGALWNSLLTTLEFTFGAVVGSIGVGLIAALALRRPFHGRTLLRATMLLPYIAPVVAVTFVWRIMLNPEYGIVNAIGKNVLGWDAPVSFLTQKASELPILGAHVSVPTALLTVIAFQVWRFFPFAFLFIMARMEAMSPEIEEAALVDGATPWQTFRHVVLPQLAPVLTVLIVLRTIWTFNEFDSIFLLTGGAAGTQVASIRVYQLLTVQQNVGAASAQSIVLAVLLIVCLGVYAAIMRKKGGAL